MEYLTLPAAFVNAKIAENEYIACGVEPLKSKLSHFRYVFLAIGVGQTSHRCRRSFPPPTAKLPAKCVPTICITRTRANVPLVILLAACAIGCEPVYLVAPKVPTRFGSKL